MVKSNSANLRYKLIKRCCVDRGTTFAEIARRLHVTQSAITHVAQGNRVSKRIQRALARSAGFKFTELWETR
jgi:transcriptional regulator with XRE-family HTH domain